jgi:hypothetical protein
VQLRRECTHLFGTQLVEADIQVLAQGDFGDGGAGLGALLDDLGFERFAVGTPRGCMKNPLDGPEMGQINLGGHLECMQSRTLHPTETPYCELEQMIFEPRGMNYLNALRRSAIT